MDNRSQPREPLTEALDEFLGRLRLRAGSHRRQRVQCKIVGSRIDKIRVPCDVVRNHIRGDLPEQYQRGERQHDKDQDQRHDTEKHIRHEKAVSQPPQQLPCQCSRPAEDENEKTNREQQAEKVSAVEFIAGGVIENRVGNNGQKQHQRDALQAGQRVHPVPHVHTILLPEYERAGSSIMTTR